jgi:hypothetical protein
MCEQLLLTSQVNQLIAIAEPLSSTCVTSEITILWSGTYAKRSKQTKRTQPGSVLAQ